MDQSEDHDSRFGALRTIKAYRGQLEISDLSPEKIDLTLESERRKINDAKT